MLYFSGHTLVGPVLLPIIGLTSKLLLLLVVLVVIDIIYK